MVVVEEVEVEVEVEVEAEADRMCQFANVP